MAELRSWITTLAFIGLGWALLFGGFWVWVGYWILPTGVSYVAATTLFAVALLLLVITGAWLVTAIIRAGDLLGYAAKNLRSRPPIQDRTLP